MRLLKKLLKSSEAEARCGGAESKSSIKKREALRLPAQKRQRRYRLVGFGKQVLGCLEGLVKVPSGPDNWRYVAGEECWFDMGGYRMRYLRMGPRTTSTGPPLVLVHGLLGYSFS